MELVLESKLIENIDLNHTNSNYFSVYSLKTNRSNASDNTQTSILNTTVPQFLDQNLTINKDFSLSLISSNLQAANESKLKEGLAKKIAKGTFYASQSGAISCFDMGFVKDEACLESICYHNYYRQSADVSNQYLICFILVDGATNLDLFRNELDLYFDTFLKKFFQKEASKELEVTNELDILLSNWFSNAIGYLYRTIELVKDNLPIVIEEAFSCGMPEFENLIEQDKNDIVFFFKSFDCNQLIVKIESKDSELNENPRMTQLLFKRSEDSKLILSKFGYSEFSLECAKDILKIYNGERDLFSIKQIIENYKLKLIQDLNTFNRYLTKGKGHYYILFKAVLQLKYSPNSDILIQVYMNRSDKDIAIQQVFNNVVEFYRRAPQTMNKLSEGRNESENLKQSENILKKFTQKYIDLN